MHAVSSPCGLQKRRDQVLQLAWRVGRERTERELVVVPGVGEVGEIFILEGGKGDVVE